MDTEKNCFIFQKTLEEKREADDYHLVKKGHSMFVIKATDDVLPLFCQYRDGILETVYDIDTYYL